MRINKANNSLGQRGCSTPFHKKKRKQNTKNCSPDQIWWKITSPLKWGCRCSSKTFNTLIQSNGSQLVYYHDTDESAEGVQQKSLTFTGLPQIMRLSVCPRFSFHSRFTAQRGYLYKSVWQSIIENRKGLIWGRDPM